LVAKLSSMTHDSGAFPVRSSRLSTKHPQRSLVELAVAYSLIGFCFWTTSSRFALPTTLLATVIAGLTYVHLAKYQHTCAHSHAFNGRRANRIAGTACGIFTLKSFTQYRYQHLCHHALLGKPHDPEFFVYGKDSLNSVWKLIYATLSYSITDTFMLLYATFLFATTACCDEVLSLFGHTLLPSRHKKLYKQAGTEYCIYLAAIFGAVAYSVAAGSLLFVWAWLAPFVLIAEPIYFLIELPEHFGLNTHTDLSVFTNTRTIHASRAVQWFVDYSNLHTVHHAYPTIPMADLPRLSDITERHAAVVECSYWNFYRRIRHGEVTGSQ
jgi:fatty acid desaturase